MGPPRTPSMSAILCCRNTASTRYFTAFRCLRFAAARKHLCKSSFSAVYSALPQCLRVAYILYTV